MSVSHYAMHTNLTQRSVSKHWRKLTWRQNSKMCAGNGVLKSEVAVLGSHDLLDTFTYAYRAICDTLHFHVHNY